MSNQINEKIQHASTNPYCTAQNVPKDLKTNESSQKMQVKFEQTNEMGYEGTLIGSEG
jgi:hypothetical protein